MKWLQVVFALGCLACGPTDFTRPEAARRRDDIVGGTLAFGDPAVVALVAPYHGGFYEFCTGTLVAPRTVLTAAHCLQNFPANAAIGIGPDSNAPVETMAITDAIGNPDYNGSINDFAVVKLQRPITSVSPITMNEAPLRSVHVGEQVRHVGFGLTSGAQTDSDGLKREVTYGIRSVQSYTFESGAPGKQTCFGDSGGPALMVMPGSTEEVLIGVVSYGDENCAQQGFDGRVDQAIPWVRSTMAAWETPTCAEYDGCVPGCTPVDQDCACLADGVCGADCLTPGNDPDCPVDCGSNGICSTASCGQPDPDCLAVGYTCSATVQCLSRQCVSSAQHPKTYCTAPCADDPECPSGLECSGGHCVFTLRPEKQLGEVCTPSVDYCVGGICTGPAGGLTRCVTSCNSAASCGSDESCVGGADSQRYCRPAGLSFVREVTLEAAPAELGPGVTRSGCSTTSASGLAALVALFFRRRRARR